MVQSGDVDTEVSIERLAKELSSIARLDWRDPDGFQFAKMPTLAHLLQLAPGKRSVERLRERLQELQVEMKEEEDQTPPRYDRSLATAWLALLALDESVDDTTVTARRDWLLTKWLTKRGHKIKSVESFKQHQEPYIYRELAIRLVESERSSAEASKPGSVPGPKPREKAASRVTAWPIREHQPIPGQEVVVLIAAQALRSGPASGLMKLVREFEPYWRATETMIYSLEGSYKEIWRAGLLHDYDHFGTLPAGFYGGLVHATELVIAASEVSSALRTHVVYLIDPHDTASLYPATASLKRECLLTSTPFLTSYGGASRWFRLEWIRRVADGAVPAARNVLVLPPKAGFAEGSALENSEGALALAAHDRHKRAMMDFAERHVTLIDRFPKRWATQATGHVLNGGSIDDKEYQEDILSDVGDRRRGELKSLIEVKSSEWREEKRTEGPGSPDWIPQLTRGRQGGVIQLARKVLSDECDTILFFQDAETSREHDTEIQVLDRAAQLADSNCLLLHDEQSANRWAENLEICLGEDGALAMTLIEAFRKIFDVELILAHPDEESGHRRSKPRQSADDSAALWARITTAAAIHIVGSLLTAFEVRAKRNEPVRFGFPWGGAIRDILGRVEQRDEGRAFDRRAVAGALGLHEFVEEHNAADLCGSRNYAVSKGDWLPLPGPVKPFGPGELRVVPTVGVIGARDRSLESHSLVDRAVQILGGEAVFYPESAFALVDGGRRDPWGGAPEKDWRDLDVLLLSAAPLQKRSTKGPTTLATALPVDLATDYSDCLGAVGTIYLEEHDGAVSQRKHEAYTQVGMSMEAIRELKADRAEVILVNGAQSGAPRKRAAWAALKAGLATTFITDVAFAWSVLKEEMPDLVPPRQRR